jgi:purine-nucleoside phosphorylase
MDQKARIAYANLETDKVSDLVLACDLDLSVQQILDFADKYKKRGKTFLARFGNRWATVMRLGPGPSAWEFGIEALAGAGAKKIIQAGVCGSISEEVGIGDLVVAESVYINDEVSRYHTDKKIIECRNDLYDFVKRQAPAMVPEDINLHFCRVVSTCTLFGQTKALLSEWSEHGQAVDLETGILFAMCEKYGLDYLAIYAVVDDKLHDMDIFTMDKFPMDKIFDNSDFLLRGLVQGIKDYNLGKPEHGLPL